MPESSNDFLTLTYDDGVAVVRLDRRGAAVNTLSPEALGAFSDVLDAIEQAAQARALVFISGKPDTFIAGADLEALRSMQTPAEVQALVERGHALIRRLRTLPMPSVAAIHGAAMGGGLEVALACSYRIATDHKATKLALPEVQLGLLPAGGGTQHLPRLIGLQSALDLLLTGKNVYPRTARRLGLVDALTYHHGLLDAAVQAARQLADGTLTPRRDAQGLGEKIVESNPLSRRVVYQQAEARVRKKTRGHYPAPFKILGCVKTGMERGLEAGLEAEAEGFAELVFTPESRALVSLFFAQRAAGRNPWKEAARPVDTVGVLGAGLMGSGIAEVSAGGGLDVVVKDRDLALAAGARRHLWEATKKKVRKRILSPFERDRLVERVVPTASYGALATAGLVVEAVPEDLALKHQVLRDTEAVLPDGAVFASNTSSIPIADIAEAAARPEAVVGMHYFSPVGQMPLLELIRTEATADWALGTAFEVGRRQGKTVIVVGDGPGFYTTRILGVYMNEALLLLEEGARIETVDEAMLDFGFPMGPYALFDLVGIGTAAKITEVLARYPVLEGRRVSRSAEKLADAGYLGQSTGKGFYRYDGTERQGVNESVYAFFGGPARTEFTDEAVQQRLALLMVNEAIACLEEGLLENPRDGDLGAVFGLGFPPFRGGPFRYVDHETAPAVAARLSRLQLQHGDRFAPNGLLREKARTGARFYEGEQT
ncbi:MAG: 3-hydroxyacyl-CoA dehydrogenase NAD-binding domain-containing protein [Rhodothermales bacterium]|nr:3-hydroxyacyl-CoA dehydrogenase NAD-binding domain-containing protein [Rhodothermales bacterium]